jgi:predicted porin
VTEGTSGFEGNRPKFVGLKGSFGTVSLGTQETPYYHVAGIIDIFNTDRSLSSTAFLGGSFSGFRLDIDPDDRSSNGGSLFRLDNSLYYSTPDFSGFTGEAMLVMNGGQNDNQGYSNNVDLWNIAAKYSNGPFFAGASYIKLEGSDNVAYLPIPGLDLDLDLEQWNIGLGYSAGPFSVGFIYEQGTLNEFGLYGNAKFGGERLYNSDDGSNWYLTGEYKFGNNTIRGAYGQLDTGLNVPGFDNTLDNYLVGYQYDFSRRTRVWVEYIGRSADDEVYRDLNAISIGTRVDF